MKTFLLKCAAGLLIAGLAFSACKKSSQSFESKGVISVVILYTCNGCGGGGYFIKFTADTTVEHHIDNDLTKFGITPNTKLPVNVSVNWTPDNTSGSNDVIITALKVDD